MIKGVLTVGSSLGVPGLEVGALPGEAPDVAVAPGPGICAG